MQTQPEEQADTAADTAAAREALREMEREVREVDAVLLPLVGEAARGLAVDRVLGYADLLRAATHAGIAAARHLHALEAVRPGASPARRAAVARAARDCVGRALEALDALAGSDESHILAGLRLAAETALARLGGCVACRASGDVVVGREGRAIYKRRCAACGGKGR